jgi:hypothetical protein
MAQIKSDSDLEEAIQQQKTNSNWNFTSSYYYYKNHNYEINLYASFFGTAESKLLPIPSLYLEKIRNNEAQLTAFFSQMPKEAIYTPF